MSTYSFPVQIRWSDIDANRHMRHSVYYDYGATARMMILSDRGLTTSKLEELQIGPILFREEAIFKREVLLEDKISIDVTLVKATPDFARMSLRHHIVKADGTIAAIINVDCAWIDVAKRKLTVPPEFIQKIVESFPRPADFQFVYPEKKS
jgi:acyl-CoA thioester hydrolase